MKTKDIHVNPESASYDKETKKYIINPMADLAVITFKKNYKLKNIKFPKILVSKHPVSLVHKRDYDSSLSLEELYNLEFRKYVAVGYGVNSFFSAPDAPIVKRSGFMKLLPFHEIGDHKHKQPLQTLPNDYLNKDENDYAKQTGNGDSGGPLFDKLGNLVGVTHGGYQFDVSKESSLSNSVFVPLYQDQNIVFFDSLMKKGKVKIGYFK